MPLFVSDFLNISDPVLVFERFMEEIDIEKYLRDIPEHVMGRVRYDPASMLKTVLFGFMEDGDISLRRLEEKCTVNIRYMYLMNHATPSYRTFGYFINDVMEGRIEEIFYDINKTIFEQEGTDLTHLYIDGTKFEANANKYSWVWKKATEKSRYRLFGKITHLLEDINEELSCMGVRIETNAEYVPEYLEDVLASYKNVWNIDEEKFAPPKPQRIAMQTNTQNGVPGSCTAKPSQTVGSSSDAVDRAVQRRPPKIGITNE